MVKFAINGFGRIGRNALRAFLQSNIKDIALVAINDPLQSIEQSAHLLQYDSVLGKLNTQVKVVGDELHVGEHKIKVFKEREPGNLPWGKLNVDIVIESSGVFTDANLAKAHIQAGAKKVLISAPAKNEDLTLVLGVNDDKYNPEKHHIISNASCTTNCLAPVAKVLHEKFGIISGLMTTIHSYTLDQRLLDTAHSDLRRARAAGQSMIPSSTGAAKAIGLVLPELNGKLNGFAMRVPTPNVSVVDLVASTEKPVSKESINKALEEASHSSLKDIMGFSNEPLVSIDFMHNKLSSIVDGDLTMTVNNNMFKVLSWYDNEWGYSNRIIELTSFVAKKMMVNVK